MVTKDEIFELIKRYYKENVKVLDPNSAPVSGKVFDECELVSAVDAVVDGWWTEGKYAEQFEQNLARFLGVDKCSCVCSGSAANLIAISALTSHLIPKEKRLLPGDEIITTAVGFPTTINPIIQNGAIPVFIDVDIPTYNARPEIIEDAITSRTKAIFLAHTMGNPFDLGKVAKIARKHDLWLIEDNCDALGSEYEEKRTGSFGNLSTQSFYPAHQITTAEGGSIACSDAILHRAIISIRDWGRDCWCRTGMSDTCKNRFGWKFGALPEGYDHKYVYTHVGYNLKITDLQAAIGVEQLKKLPKFCDIRRRNFDSLSKRFKEEHIDEHMILPVPTAKSNPSWFGYVMTLNDHSINREALLRYINKRKVDSRLLFAGNITKQPYFQNYNIKHRIAGDLTNSNTIMKDTFWIGVYPALKEDHLAYIVRVIKDFLKSVNL